MTIIFSLICIFFLTVCFVDCCCIFGRKRPKDDDNAQIEWIKKNM